MVGSITPILLRKSEVVAALRRRRDRSVAEEDEGSMVEWSALSQYPIETAGKLVQPTPKSATTMGE